MHPSPPVWLSRFSAIITYRPTLDLQARWQPLHVVVNRYGQAKQLRISQAEEALGMSILHCLPCNPAPVHHSLNSGVPVVLCRSRAKISRSIRSLAGLVTSMNGQCRTS